MDLQEKHQLDLAKQVALAKARTRPWRAIIALVLAIAAAGVSFTSGTGLTRLFEHGRLVSSVVTVAAAAAFLLFGIVAVVGLAGKSREVLKPVTGSAHAAVVRYTIVLVGIVATLVITLALLKIPVGQLIVGGALTTILIGIAAQQSLSNVFAGIVLLLSRPFNVGDQIVLRSGALGGQIEGRVTEIGITYVRLDTGAGDMHLPNSQVLAAGVSHMAATTPQPTSRMAGAPPAAGQGTAGPAATASLAADGMAAPSAASRPAAPGSQPLPPSGARVQDGGSPAS